MKLLALNVHGTHILTNLSVTVWHLFFQRCHFCEKGDKEELLLLCDHCDKGYHTYCHKPKMSTVPDGEWFCANCLSKVMTITLRHKTCLPK